jgi:hypothetical protein
LSWEVCADVDHALSDLVGMMPWPRFAKILSAAILDADPALAKERAERARAGKDVFSFDSADGLKTIVAKAAAGDAIWFMATINRIAEILAARGDSDPIGPGGPGRSAYWRGRLRRCNCCSSINMTPTPPTSHPEPTNQASPASQKNPTSQASPPSQAKLRHPGTQRPCPNPKPQSPHRRGRTCRMWSPMIIGRCR